MRSRKTLRSVCCVAALAVVCSLTNGRSDAGVPPGQRQAGIPKDKKAQAVIEEVEKACRERTVYMIGPKKAARLAELVRQKKPGCIVECGTAIGYSGLWMARELKALGKGKLISIELNPERAKDARENFRRAGLSEFVEVRVGDAKKVVRTVDGPVHLLFIDCGYSNYLPCFQGIEKELADGAVIVADNVGIGESGLGGYLKLMRTRYDSRTEWFDVDLPWAKRDAMEVTHYRSKTPQ